MKKQTTALFFFAVALAAIASCASRPPERPALYELELTECTAKSSTLTQSVTCENEVRARYGRPLRALPLQARDGGAE